MQCGQPGCERWHVLQGKKKKKKKKWTGDFRCDMNIWRPASKGGTSGCRGAECCARRLAAAAEGSALATAQEGQEGGGDGGEGGEEEDVEEEEEEEEEEELEELEEAELEEEERKEQEAEQEADVVAVVVPVAVCRLLHNGLCHHVNTMPRLNCSSHFEIDDEFITLCVAAGACEEGSTARLATEDDVGGELHAASDVLCGEAALVRYVMQECADKTIEYVLTCEPVTGTELYFSYVAHVDMCKSDPDPVSSLAAWVVELVLPATWDHPEQSQVRL